MEAFNNYAHEAFLSMAPLDAQDIAEMEDAAELRYAENAWLRAAENNMDW